MTSSNSLRRAVRCALLSGAAATAFTALPAAAQESTTLREVIVTGSRIAKRDAVADSPILTVDQEAIADSGYVTVEQYINTLPQVVAGLSSQSNNPSSNGRAFLDLRGLGNNRNLVLIDGRRGMGSTSGGVVDINTIPAALIERVELITGGAGAVYGADAIAGVVNFIMKKNFDGFSIDSTYRITEESDGEEWGTDFTFGGTFADGRGSAVFNAGYFKRDDIYKGAREFSAQAGATTATFPGGGWSPGTNTPSQAAVDAAFGAGACALNGGTANYGFNPDGTLFCTGVQGDPAFNAVGFTGPSSWIATQFYPDLFSYNFEPDNILVLPMERWSFYSRMDLDLNDYFRPYFTAMFTNYNALQELAPTPAAGTTGFTVPVTNPFIPAQLAGLLATRGTPGAAFSFSKRFNDVGGRTGFNNHDVWHVTLGATGDIVSSWKYDFYASFGRAVQTEIQGGNIRRDRVQALLNAADGGASLCAGGLNLFGSAPATTLSQACIDYISLEAKNLTVNEQMIVEATATGDLFELPAGTVQAAFGASYRDLEFDFRPDGGLQPGLVAGFNQQLPVSGQLDYTDVYTEVSVPIVSDVPGVQDLSISGGYRITDNNVFGSENTWKIALDWTIIDWVRARASFQHAVRSPNIAELFSPQLNNFPTFTNSDPCNTTGTIAATYRNGPNGAQVQALCAAQSAVAGGPTYVQPFGQATGITGGNPNLDPEVADSFTLGFVVNAPSDNPMLERLTVSVDYFNISLEEVIAAFNAVTIVQRCFNRDNANPTYSIGNSWCQLFNREASNGGVIDLLQTQQNQSLWEVAGIDIAVNWGLGLGENAGDLNLNLVATWTEKFEERDTVDSPLYNFAGSIGALTAQSFPEWRGTFTTTYSWNDLQVQLVSRYIDSMINRNVVTGSSPISNTGTKETWYFDLSARYDLTDNISLRATVNNLSNQEPRLYTPFVQANTDPSLYDVLGRRYFVGINFRM